MAATIRNDNAAMMAVGDLMRNTTKLGKQLKKVSSGQRINGANDGPSEFSISEKMRIRIRALDQDERNVQNGAALLRVAEGGIQQQIEIMKTIKQKVIDADNDTNTDLDRMTIQKEINQGYRQIEDIAQEVNYNGKRLLVGDTLYDTIRSWIVTDTPVLMPDSDDLNLIPDNYANDQYVSADGTKYDKFKEYGSSNVPISTMSLNATNSFANGGMTATPRIMSFDLSACNLSDLNNNSTGIGFYVQQASANGYSTSTKYFVITTDPSATYNVITGNNSSTTATKILVNNSMSKTDIAQAMANAINANTTDTLLRTEVDGLKVKVSTQSGYSHVDYANYCSIGGFKSDEDPNYELYTTYTVYEDSTNISWGYLTGGNYASGPTPTNPDAVVIPAKDDKITRNISSSPSGSFVRISGSGANAAKLSFVDGDALNGNTVGKNYNGSFNVGGVTVTMDGAGNVTFSSPYAGGYTSYITDGSSSHTEKNITGTVAVKELKSLTGTQIKATSKVDQKAENKDKKRAYCTFDVSAQTGTTKEDLELFIKDLKGKLLRWHYRTDETYSSSYYWGNEYYAFVDKGGDNISETMTGQYASRDIDAQACADTTNKVLDLNELRGKINNVDSVADIVSNWLKEKFGSRVKTHSDDANIPAGEVRFQAYLNGTAGNDDKLYVTEGSWRKYEIDFTSALAGKSIPEDLDGRGFRFYCATHHGQWFNFEFLNGNIDDKPLSGTDTSDIKTLLIDVSGVADAEGLVKAIYDQAMPKLAGGDGYWDHYLRLATDGGKLTLYDKRARNIHTSEYEYQVDGAKLADGILDNVVRGKRNIYVKDLVIHHTDHASQNIHIKIPQTTMDHLFGYVAGEKEFEDFNVLTSANREKLLGNKAGKTRSGDVIFEDEDGLLDKALNYLTGANTLVGAQIMRLGMTENNIVTARESTTSSESTIRDADMAKEMMEYTKANVLAQASQSMLAQANQNSGAVLSLLA